MIASKEGSGWVRKEFKKRRTGRSVSEPPVDLKEKTLKSLKEENSRLLYTIEEKENPIRLMELSRDKKFAHLFQNLV